MSKKKFVVIAYDICDDKHRTKVAKLLQKYGVRANFSVFECFVSSKDLLYIENEIKNIINTKTDSILIYKLCGSCIEKRKYIGFEPTDRNLIVSV